MIGHYFTLLYVASYCERAACLHSSATLKYLCRPHLHGHGRIQQVFINVFSISLSISVQRISYVQFPFMVKKLKLKSTWKSHKNEVARGIPIMLLVNYVILPLQLQSHFPNVTLYYRMHVYYMTNKNNRTSQDNNVDEMINMDVLGADVTIKRTTIFLKSV